MGGISTGRTLGSWGGGVFSLCKQHKSLDLFPSFSFSFPKSLVLARPGSLFQLFIQASHPSPVHALHGILRDLGVIQDPCIPGT